MVLEEDIVYGNIISDATVQMRMHPPGADNAESRHTFVRSNDKIIKVKSSARSKNRRTKTKN